MTGFCKGTKAVVDRRKFDSDLLLEGLLNLKIGRLNNGIEEHSRRLRLTILNRSRVFHMRLHDVNRLAIVDREAAAPSLVFYPLRIGLT